VTGENGTSTVLVEDLEVLAALPAELLGEPPHAANEVILASSSTTVSALVRQRVFAARLPPVTLRGSY